MYSKQIVFFFISQGPKGYQGPAGMPGEQVSDD